MVLHYIVRLRKLQQSDPEWIAIISELMSEELDSNDRIDDGKASIFGNLKFRLNLMSRAAAQHHEWCVRANSAKKTVQVQEAPLMHAAILQTVEGIANIFQISSLRAHTQIVDHH